MGQQGLRTGPSRFSQSPRPRPGRRRSSRHMLWASTRSPGRLLSRRARSPTQAAPTAPTSSTALSRAGATTWSKSGRFQTESGPSNTLSNTTQSGSAPSHGPQTSASPQQPSPLQARTATLSYGARTGPTRPGTKRSLPPCQRHHGPSPFPSQETSLLSQVLTETSLSGRKTSTHSGAKSHPSQNNKPPPPE